MTYCAIPCCLPKAGTPLLWTVSCAAADEGAEPVQPDGRPWDEAAPGKDHLLLLISCGTRSP